MGTAAPPQTQSLESRGLPLADPTQQLAALNALELPREFHEALEGAGLWPLTPVSPRVLQLNLGKLCNQTCRHCHVDAGPDRQEVMSPETMRACVEALARTEIPVVDITGGAPELVVGFRDLIKECRALGRQVMDRCNLTVLHNPKQRDLPEFFAEHEVEVVCSLPHFRAGNTDRQRGEGVFDKSIASLRRLNEVGYGRGDPRRRLVLVTNPVGAFLPGAQGSLEAEWKRELQRLHGVTFDALYTITNMPISRYLEWLEASGNLQAYMQRLVHSFNPSAAAGVMCRDTISVDWQGYLYDCDFNQMLGLRVDRRAPQHVSELELDKLAARSIRVARHCFGCTAGAGSSCGGATT